MALRPIPFLLVGLAVPSCAPDSGPEEVLAAEGEVPGVVVAAAERVAERLGGELGAWVWDRESLDWEVPLLGLARQAELDILPDGRFSELELVHTLAEVEAAVPAAAAAIRQRCGGEQDAFIELSLRSERHLEPLLTLAQAWQLDSVVLEFQCASGADYELDARNLLLEHRLDDREEPAGK